MLWRVGATGLSDRETALRVHGPGPASPGLSGRPHGASWQHTEMGPGSKIGQQTRTGRKGAVPLGRKRGAAETEMKANKYIAKATGLSRGGVCTPVRWDVACPPEVRCFPAALHPGPRSPLPLLLHTLRTAARAGGQPGPGSRPSSHRPGTCPSPRQSCSRGALALTTRHQMQGAHDRQLL